MSKENQIMEMAKDLRATYNAEGCDAWHCSGCKYEQYSVGYLCQEVQQAEKLAQMGYHKQSGWISVEDSLPKEFVPVLGYVTDAGDFPPVRECYLVGVGFFFPALRAVHPISHWMPMPAPPTATGEE